jgi:hypothetical protein
MKNNLYRSENLALKRNIKKDIKKHNQINKLKNTFSYRGIKRMPKLQDKDKNKDNFDLTNKEFKLKQTKEKKDKKIVQIFNTIYFITEISMITKCS